MYRVQAYSGILLLVRFLCLLIISLICTIPLNLHRIEDMEEDTLYFMLQSGLEDKIKFKVPRACRDFCFGRDRIGGQAGASPPLPSQFVRSVCIGALSLDSRNRFQGKGCALSLGKIFFSASLDAFSDHFLMLV